MKRILNRQRENGRNELRMEKFIYLHTYFSYAIMLLLVPMLLIASVAAITTIIMLPVSYLCGWC